MITAERIEERIAYKQKMIEIASNHVVLADDIPELEEELEILRLARAAVLVREALNCNQRKCIIEMETVSGPPDPCGICSEIRAIITGGKS